MIMDIMMATFGQRATEIIMAITLLVPIAIVVWDITHDLEGR